MPNDKMWMVRAGQGATYVDDFIDKKVVAIGWSEIGDINVGDTRETISQTLAEVWSAITSGKRSIQGQTTIS